MMSETSDSLALQLSSDAPDALVEKTYRPKPLGWQDVREMYLNQVSLKQISRLSGYTVKGIIQHAKVQKWPAQRTALSEAIYQDVLDKFGERANQQTDTLIGLSGHLGRLMGQELQRWETQPPKTKAAELSKQRRSQTLSAYAQTISQVGQQLRLLTGKSTEKKEITTLSQLVVELRAHGYGQEPEREITPKRFASQEPTERQEIT